MGRIACRVFTSILAAAALAVGALWLARAAAQPAAHGEHGTPAGWTLSWPAGDPGRGRAAFVRFECHSCHEIRGERFPTPSEPGRLGPELSAMGPLHEAAYFVEAIVNPNAVVDRGRGYEAADGTSKMPSYNDSLTVQELIDLVAYLKTLRPPATGPAGSGAGAPGGHDVHH
jgi:mono/diheme cytochrome c family protein